MKRSRVVVLSAMTPALLFAAGVARTQQYPPVWTDIMNQLGLSTMASGTFWQFSNLTGNGDIEVPSTDLYSYPNFTIPGLSSGTPASNGGAQGYPCYRQITQPTQFLESNQGTGITGIGFLGTFQGQSMPGGDFTESQSGLTEAVFFHENQCYDLGNSPSGQPLYTTNPNGQPTAGREYGFFYDPYGNGIYAYWGTHLNIPSYSQVEANMLLAPPNNGLENGVTIQPGTEYYFEMYPILRPYGRCTFQISVYGTSGQLLFSAGSPLTGYGANQLFAVDPNFCSEIASDTGFVSATTIMTPPVLNIPSTINLNMRRIYVGKD